jgi:hypothetical protein
MNKKLLVALIAATLGCGLASAQTTPTTPNATTEQATSPAPAGLSQEAKDDKVRAKAEYKARKQVAGANKTLNKADCEVKADGMLEHACKNEARAAAKLEKAEAKTTYEIEKKQIKQADK